MNPRKTLSQTLLWFSTTAASHHTYKQFYIHPVLYQLFCFEQTDNFSLSNASLFPALILPDIHLSLWTVTIITAEYKHTLIPTINSKKKWFNVIKIFRILRIIALTSLTQPVKLTFWRFSAWQQWYLSCICIYLLDKKWHKGWEKDCPITSIHTYCIFAHTTAGRLCLHSYNDNGCVHCGAPLFNFDFGRWVKSLYCSPSLVLWTIKFPRGFLLSSLLHSHTNKYPDMDNR